VNQGLKTESNQATVNLPKHRINSALQSPLCRHCADRFLIEPIEEAPALLPQTARATIVALLDGVKSSISQMRGEKSHLFLRKCNPINLLLQFGATQKLLPFSSTLSNFDL
jgi:hypothetical protein